MCLAFRSYPSTSAKENLAKAIVTEFPFLKSKHSTLGYVSLLSFCFYYNKCIAVVYIRLSTFQEHFFDRKTGTGYLEMRLWTIRKDLTPSKKKRSSSTGGKKVKKRFRFEGASTDWKKKPLLSEDDLTIAVSSVLYENVLGVVSKPGTYI